MSANHEISSIRQELANAKFWFYASGLVFLGALGFFIAFALIQNETAKNGGLLASGLTALWSLTGLITISVIWRSEKKQLQRIEYRRDRGYI